MRGACTPHVAGPLCLQEEEQARHASKESRCCAEHTAPASPQPPHTDPPSPQPRLHPALPPSPHPRTQPLHHHSLRTQPGPTASPVHSPPVTTASPAPSVPPPACFPCPRCNRPRCNSRREERKRRDAFRALLTAQHTAGKLNARSEWKDVQPGLASTPEYKAATQQTGSTPAELFDDFRSQLLEAYAAQRRVLKAAVGEHESCVPTEATTLADFEAALFALGRVELTQLPQEALATYLEELQVRPRCI